MTNFCDIDSLNEIAAASEWDCSYQQMRPGRLAAGSTLLQVGQSLLLREQVSHSVEFRGAPSSSHVAFLFVSQHQGARIAGTDPGTADIGFIPPGYDLSMISGDAVDICTISIPSSALMSNQAQVDSNRSLAHGSAPRPLPLSYQDRLGLMSRIKACFCAASDDALLDALERVLIDTLSDLLAKRSGAPGLERNRRHVRHSRLLQVVDYLNAEHHRLVSVPEMAEVASTTERTLTRYFKEHYGMPPFQYDRARRLNHARRVLAQRGMTTGSVTDAAINNGFAHLGRFSIEFRDLFGFSPSKFLADTVGNTAVPGLANGAQEQQIDL